MKEKIPLPGPTPLRVYSVDTLAPPCHAPAARFARGCGRALPKWSGGILVLLLALGCSSTPKGPVERRTLRNAGATQLELANRETDRGNYEGALELLEEARRLAVTTDDSALIVRTYLSLGNVYSFLGRDDEAAACQNRAVAEADRAGDGELSALCVIYRERRRLLNDNASAAEVRDKVQAALSGIRTNPLDEAAGWIVAGLAEKELRRFAQAEDALKKALALHARYPEQAAYDWYIIASIRSVAGDYDAALDALDQALNYDRRAENSYGLGKDWLARGDVLSRAGRREDAADAWRRAAEIFASAGLDVEAASAAIRE